MTDLRQIGSGLSLFPPLSLHSYVPESSLNLASTGHRIEPGNNHVDDNNNIDTGKDISDRAWIEFQK